ncbi:MAG: nucleotidyltransferase domain-containing protein [Methanobrevibacter sp.]|jgi:predicted nucleotidyltransferase|nr:nucleotidyltransferase domain-containing protein [Candidatus Methanoflexus mossambicus]
MNKKDVAIKFANSLNFPEIKKIILYGSVARNEDTENSDIDILIITSDKKKIKHAVYRKVTDILIEFEEYISAKILKIEDYKQIKQTHFISTVEKEGVLIG